MASGTSQVQETSRGQHDDTAAVRENKPIDLRLNVFDFDALCTLESSHIDFVVEVANVTNDCIVLHLLHHIDCDDVEVAGGCHEDIDLSNDTFHWSNLETFHACLQSANRIDLGDYHATTATTHCERRALANIAIPTNQNAFPSDHDICGTHDAIRKRMPATIDIVKFRLCHTIVHIDCGHQQCTFRCHFFQTVHTCGRLFTHSLPIIGHSCPFLGVDLDRIPDQSQHAFEFSICG